MSELKRELHPKPDQATDGDSSAKSTDGPELQTDDGDDIDDDVWR